VLLSKMVLVLLLLRIRPLTAASFCGRCCRWQHDRIPATTGGGSFIQGKGGCVYLNPMTPWFWRTRTWLTEIDWHCLVSLTRTISSLFLFLSFVSQPGNSSKASPLSVFCGCVGLWSFNKANGDTVFFRLASPHLKAHAPAKDLKTRALLHSYQARIVAYSTSTDCTKTVMMMAGCLPCFWLSVALLSRVVGAPILKKGF
jgi:hypothetical protein